MGLRSDSVPQCHMTMLEPGSPHSHAFSSAKLPSAVGDWPVLSSIPSLPLPFPFLLCPFPSLPHVFLFLSFYPIRPRFNSITPWTWQGSWGQEESPQRAWGWGHRETSWNLQRLHGSFPLPFIGPQTTEISRDSVHARRWQQVEWVLMGTIVKNRMAVFVFLSCPLPNSPTKHPGSDMKKVAANRTESKEGNKDLPGNWGFWKKKKSPLRL